MLTLPIRQTHRRQNGSTPIGVAAPAHRTEKRGALYAAAVHQKSNSLLQSLDSDTDTNLDTYIRLEDGIDSDSRESDTESDAELDAESNAESDAGLDVELDSEAEEILKDIAELEEEGPAKPNHTSYTKKL
jgi:hypothetical protein